MNHYMAEPERIMKNYRSKFIKDERSYHYGKLAMCLEIISVIRALDTTAVGNSLLGLNREEAVSVLETVLNNSGMREWAEREYDRLCEERRPTWVADETVLG